jgi:spore coat protein JB
MHYKGDVFLMAEYNENLRREKLRQVQEADFLALDLQLYLNTHPDCIRALELYTKTIKNAKELRKEYEKEYGPLTAGASSAQSPWQWIKNPWTWDKERS